MDNLELPPEYKKLLQKCVNILVDDLKDNLHSLVLYGSAVRGGMIRKISNLNLLLVLNHSTPEAHKVIASAIHASEEIHPFIVCREGLDRSYNAFAIKFESIKRNYVVLHGEDPFAAMGADPEILRFLTEQALRNLRLRCVHTFVTLGHDRRRYLHYLIHVIPQVFTDLGTALRIRGVNVPHDFADRPSAFGACLDADTSVLEDMLRLKEKPRQLSEQEVFTYHSRLFRLLDRTVEWLTQ